MPGAARPAAVGDPGPPGPAAVHAEERAQVHAGLGADRSRCGRRRRKREVSYALCNDRRTLLWFANQRAVEYHPTLVRADRLGPPDPPRARPRPARGRRASRRRCRGRAAGPAGARPTPAWPARSRPAAPRACTCSCRSPARRDRGRRRRRPGRSPRGPSGSTRRSPPPRSSGRTAAARCSSTRPGPAARPWWPRTARGSGPACRCRSRWPGTTSTASTPADFTVHTAPGLLGDRDPWAELMPAAAGAARRPGRGGPHHPDRPGAGDARGQAPRPRPPRVAHVEQPIRGSDRRCRPYRWRATIADRVEGPPDQAEASA